MNYRAIVFCMGFLAVSSASFASEESDDAMPTTFLARYASDAHELVLRALSFVGANYRRGGEIRIEDMRQNYWSRRFNGARRIAAAMADSAAN